MPSSEGVAAIRPKYMGGGMSGIMTGINPTAGLTPRVGYADGPKPGSTLGKGFSITGSTGSSPIGTGRVFYPPVTTTPAGVPATISSTVIPELPKSVSTSTPSRLSRILSKIPGAGRLGLLGTYGAAAGTGYGIGQIADYITKSGDTPEAYALRKQIMEEDPFTFDETNMEVGDAIARIEAADVGEKYGFMPRGGKAQRLKDLGLEGKFDAKTGERIKEQEVVENPQEEIPKNKKQQDPEKSLMDIYGENKGIIDQVMGNSDEDTKKSLYLQLAKFGAGLAAQPGGDLVGAIGKAAMPAIAGTEKTLADKRKGDREVKLMALSKTFEDMKQPEQVKLVKAIQKEFGFDTFKEAYEYISKQKKSGAQLRDEDKFYRETAKEMGVSTDGFRREMQALDEMGLGAYVGNFTRPDALLPEDIDDRVPGEYYVNTKGKPLRFIDGKLYGPKEKQFTKKIETKET
jgi:hypothetical protein